MRTEGEEDIQIEKNRQVCEGIEWRGGMREAQSDRRRNRRVGGIKWR